MLQRQPLQHPLHAGRRRPADLAEEVEQQWRHALRLRLFGDARPFRHPGGEIPGGIPQLAAPLGVARHAGEPAQKQIYGIVHAVSVIEGTENPADCQEWPHRP